MAGSDPGAEGGGHRRWSVEITAERLDRAKQAVMALERDSAAARRTRTPGPVRKVISLIITFVAASNSASATVVSALAHQLRWELLFAGLTLLTTVLFLLILFQGVLAEHLLAYTARRSDARVQEAFRQVASRLPLTVEYALHADRLESQSPTLGQRVTPFPRIRSAMVGEGVAVVRRRLSRGLVVFFGGQGDAEAFVSGLTAAGVKVVHVST